MTDEKDIHTINQLSEITGFDRRTLKKMLIDTKPAKVAGRRKYYRRSDVHGEPRNPRAAIRSSNDDEHPLFGVCEKFMLMYATYDEFMAEWMKWSDRVHAMKDGDPFSEMMTEELNQISVVYGKPVFELLLWGARDRKRKNIEKFVDVYVIFRWFVQALLDVDMTLNVSQFFNTQMGREMKFNALSKNQKSKKIKFPFSVPWLKERTE